jgi:hypothetical protein
MPNSPGPVEILGPWLLNKGDELMLRAVMERLGPRHLLAVSSDLGGALPSGRSSLHRVRWSPEWKEYASAIRSGSVRRLFQLARRSAGLTLLPAPFVERNGYVSGSSLTGLLDCSGFAYGDQWSTRRPEKRREYLTRLKRQGCRLILLPQALGPFDDPEVRDSARALLNQFDLVFAREADSFEHVRGLELTGPRVGFAPDITHLAGPVPPPDPDVWASRVCVVPNTRMMDKTAPEVGRRYLDFLIRAIHAFRKGGLEPCLVIHERNDGLLVEELMKGLDFALPVVDEDGAVTKGVLGASYAVLSSRYHALVGALSQGTPALGTSWAHKYDALFEEYGCPECLVRPDRGPDEVESVIRDFIEPGRREALSERLTRIAGEQRAAVERMWEEVEAVLNDLQPSRKFDPPAAEATVS